MFGICGIAPARNLSALIFCCRVQCVLKGKERNEDVTFGVAVKAFAPITFFVVRVGFSVELGRAVITAERNWGGALELRAIPFHHLRLAWFSLPVSNSLNEIGVALKLWA